MKETQPRRGCRKVPIPRRTPERRCSYFSASRKGTLTVVQYAMTEPLSLAGVDYCGGPPGAIAAGGYYAVDSYYPGGWPGALWDYSQSANQNLENGIWDPGKI